MKTTDMRLATRRRFASQITKRANVRALALVCAAIGSGLLLTAQQPQPVGSWAPMAQHVADSRVGAASAVLPDGRTLIAGGLVDGLPVASVVIYDPLTNAVVAAGELTAARVGHSATLLDDGRVLFAGGRVADQVTPDLELFSLPTDLEQSSSALVGTMLAEREGHAAATLADGSVLIAGGANAGGPLGSAEIFDPVSNTVQATWHPMDTARAGASATRLIDGRVLIAGGTTRDGDGTIRDLASAEMYEPELQAFYPATTEMSVARSGHTALLLPHNNSVLIAGGSSNGALVASADLFLPAEFPDAVSVGTGEFAPTGVMLAPRHGAVAGPAADHGFAFVAGGTSVGEHGESVVSANAEAYRFATIVTDKDDYYPGETVFITGSGWVPGETVSLLLQEWDNEHSDRVFEPIAEADGTIAASFLVEEHHLGVRFYLTARGAESKAQITFTDAVNKATIPTFTLATGASTCGTLEVSTSLASEALCATSRLSTNTGNPSNNFVEFLWFRQGEVAQAFTQRYPSAGVLAGGIDNQAATSIQTPDQAGTWTVKVCQSDSKCNNVPTTLASANISITPSSRTLTLSGSGAGAGTVTSNPSGISCTIEAGNATGSCSATFSNDATVTLTAMASASVPTSAGSTFAEWSGDGTGTVARNVTMTANKSVNAHFMANQTISLDAIPSKTFGDAPFVVSASASSGLPVTFDIVSGPATISGDTVTITGAGSITVRVAQSGDADYNAAEKTVSITVDKADPVVTWSDAANITYGTALDETQLNASSSGDGALTYEPAAGTVLNAGVHSLKVTAAETDNYNAAEKTVSITVDKGDQVITWSDAANITYGTALDVTQLNASSSGDGALTYEPAAGTMLNAGTHSLKVTAAETDNYNAAEKTVSITVNKANATIAVQGTTVTYNGDAHGASGSATGVQGETLAGLDLGASFTNVPGGTANWAFTDVTGNYYDANDSVAVVITPKELTVSGITANGKPWDGNNVATLDVTNAVLVGVEAGDAVTLNTGAATGTFASSSVGEWTVTITGLTISGASSGNYTLTQPTTTASIGAWHITGFHQPVGAVNSIVLPPLPPNEPLPTGNGSLWHMIKGGNTVPLKFNVYTAQGGTELTTTSAAIASFQAWRLSSCVGGTEEIELSQLEELSTGGTVLRYDATGGQFIQNWQTPKVGGSDLCYRATVTAKDGSTITAFFKVRK